MIGQKNLKARLSELIAHNNFPHFVILSGIKGSGKRTLARELAVELDIQYVEVDDVKIDTIREVINMAYQCAVPTVYIIPDADNMSTAAKNSLLKVTEEPPNNAYFIMTSCDTAKILATITSRATVFNMEPYSAEEICEYTELNFALDLEAVGTIIDIAETPLEVNQLVSYGVSAFHDYVISVVDNVAQVSGANSFKIANRIAMKDETDKFDLRLFWKTFMLICVKRMLDEKDKVLYYADGVTVTSDHLQQLTITGINKQMTFDHWLFSIRSRWNVST